MSNVWRYEVVTVNQLTGQEQVSSLHYQTDVPVLGSEPSGAEVLEQIDQHFSSSGRNLSVFKAATSSLCSFTNTRARLEVQWWLDELGELAEDPKTGVGTIAAGTTSVTPDGLCPWIKLTTAVASRSSRGGIHLPGPYPTSLIEGDGTWKQDAGSWAGVTNLAVAIVDQLEDVFDSTGDINPVIYSQTRRRNGLSPFVFKLTASSVSDEPRWLRRRMRRG